MVIVKAGDATPSLGEGVAKPRLFILSNVQILCEGLSLALSQQPSVIVVGSADLSTPPAQIAEYHPHVLLLDIATPRGLSMSVPLRQMLPTTKIVAIAVAEVEHEVIACAEAGVSGFVSCKGSIRDVVAAAHSAVRGELVCSPRMAALLFSRLRTLSATRTDAPHNTLTPREQEVSSLLGQGLSNKEIARLLRIQHATVKNHIHSILSKLQVQRRGQVGARIQGTDLRLSQAAIWATSVKADRTSTTASD